MNLQELQQELKSHPNPVVVDFWAPWCGPCRVSKPILESLGKEYQGRVDLVMVNADDSPELLQELRIFGIPTVLVTRSGAILSRVSGAQSLENYRSIFEALTNSVGVPILSMSVFDRSLRLLVGTALGIAGISSNAWILIAIGGGIAFLGVYDRCPIWRAITGHFRKRTP